ncbi:hypothetical protein XI08_24425 [Bradyrhizobium sp. CCBAU 11361]|nr:hypothetical protein [Bradyrhizobium sp. CCBAU 11361]
MAQHGGFLAAGPSMHPDLPHSQLKIRRVRLDTGRENVVVISRQSKALLETLLTPPSLRDCSNTNIAEFPFH